MTIPKSELHPGLAFVYYGKNKKRITHDRAMSLIVMLLHNEGYEVNYDTQQCYAPIRRAEHLPLYLVTSSRRRRADIVFQLNKDTLVAIEVTTWKIEKLKRSIKNRVYRHLNDKEDE